MKTSYPYNERVGDAAIAVLVFFGILFGVSVIGLLLSIIKPVLWALGIENNL